jgi:hypothetical protein
MAEAARVDEYAQYCASPIVHTDDAIGWVIIQHAGIAGMP